MMSDFLWALAGTQFLFVMTTLGAALVFLGRGASAPRGQELLLGFAGGVMSAAAVWSLLLPAIEQAEAGRLPGWLPASAGLLSGALFLAALDRVQSGAAEREHMLFTAITLHNIPEGMAVGLAFALASGGEGRTAALALALGVGVQNFPEGAAVALPMRQLGMGKGRAFLWGALSGAVEPVFGLLAFLLAGAARPAMPWLLSFSAGAMLYVTAHELCPAARSFAGSFGYVGGFTLMMALDVALG